MNTILKASFIALLASLIACTQNSQALKDKDLAGSLTKEVTLAFNSGNVNKLMTYFADDAIVISCGWRMSGKDSIASGMKYMLEHSSNMNTSIGPFSVNGNVIFIQGLITFNWKNESYSALAKGSMIMIWKKQNDDSWKITFEEENHGDLPEK
ncbi:MAG: nuclear transport factor 2 family protein [Bacteroidales bacterium]|jgi:ketosteroid isomerase-like protein